MTNEELLAKLWILPADVTELQHVAKAVQALRAVVELHKPNDEFVDDVIVCSECYRDFYFGGEYYEYGKYPCKTIQAIEKELD